MAEFEYRLSPSGLGIHFQGRILEALIQFAGNSNKKEKAVSEESKLECTLSWKAEDETVVANIMGLRAFYKRPLDLVISKYLRNGHSIMF